MVKTNIRLPMSVKQRAKQFAMFDAMKGLTEAIAEKERQISPKKELVDDRIAELNEMLTMIKIGDKVTVDYYCQYGQKYETLTGTVTKVDLFWKEVLLGETTVAFDEIANISFV